jgi:leucyl/phenylalanyl-tRNA--protein transferase
VVDARPPQSPNGPADVPPNAWEFPSPDSADEHGLVCLGGDLEPGTLLAAYRQGLFPMPVPAGRFMRARNVLGWFSPDPRAIIPLDGVRVSRSLRRSRARFEITSDTAFEHVMRACGDPRRPHGWITEEFVGAYTRLHQAGYAHSVEAWLDGELVGGLYGVAIGGLFAGESMFHTATDASKVALVDVVERLRAGGFGLLDVQWLTEHLASLGAVEIDRPNYLRRLAEVVDRAGIWTAR